MSAEHNFAKYDRGVFEYILDNIPDSITIVDMEGRVIFFNSTAEEYFGVLKRDILNKDVKEFFPNAILPRVLDSRMPFYNIYNSPRENSFVVASAVPLSDDKGNMIGALARDRDITEIVRLSELLNKTQANLLNLEKEYSKISSSGEAYFSKIISNNAGFIQTINLCKNISKSPLNILLKGESGTGKELFAKAIHYESGRKGKFIPINCSAIPRELFESELFGYEGGAFIGGRKEGKAGIFEIANGGTVFLDEIGDMAPHLQAKLLRVLQEKRVRRVGGTDEINVDVRLISATNQNIDEMVKNREFRIELLFRINIFSIHIPALRERKEDIPVLYEYFAGIHAKRYSKEIDGIDREAMKKLIGYNWPGNVREFQNVLERAVALSTAKYIVPKDIFLNYDIVPHENSDINSLKDYLESLEKKKIIEGLRQSRSIREAAKNLNVTHTLLINRMKKYGIDIKQIANY